MAKKIELLVTLRGDREFWPAGTIFDYDQMPREIASEISLNRGTVRIFEQVEQRSAVPPPPPPSPQPSFSDVAKDLLKEGLKEEAEEEEVEEERPEFDLNYKGGGWYDVINTRTGEKMNTSAVRKDEAEALIKELTGEVPKPTLVSRGEDSD